MEAGSRNPSSKLSGEDIFGKSDLRLARLSTFQPLPFVSSRSTFVSKEARRKSGNLGYEPRTNGNLSNDSLVTWRGDTGLIHTVKTNNSGAIESGTLESLVRILIENFGE